MVTDQPQKSCKGKSSTMNPVRSNTTWLVPRPSDKSNYWGNGVVHTERHWNYIQGQRLNQSFTDSTLLFLAHMAYLCLLFSTTIYYPSQRLTKYLGFPLEFNTFLLPFPLKNSGSCTAVSVEDWWTCTNSPPYYKDNSYTSGGRCSIFRLIKWLTAILPKDTGMT